MKIFLYRLWQCTWGVLQTLLGGALFLIHLSDRHYGYHGAVVTEWKAPSSISLGMFVFVTARPFFAEKYEGQIEISELSNRLLVHEYGHTVQSLILGPLYLIVMGIPSTIWGFACAKTRKEKQIPYGAFFTERWANVLGEKVTREASISDLVLE